VGGDAPGRWGKERNCLGFGIGDLAGVSAECCIKGLRSDATKAVQYGTSGYTSCTSFSVADCRIEAVEQSTAEEVVAGLIG
jgi:hypothetical protein